MSEELTRTRTREPLPSREQIDALTDPAALREIADRVEWARQKIEADLEFGSGDDEWARRAISALTAHRICHGNLQRRLRQLERKVPADPVAKDRTKAEKHAAHADRLRAEAEARLTKVERERLALVNQMLAFSRKTSWLSAFHAAAAKQLDQATLSRIANAAHAAVEGALLEAAQEQEAPASVAARAGTRVAAGSEQSEHRDEPLPLPKSEGQDQ